jgi:uncharacterized protein (DUF1778 family)
MVEPNLSDDSEDRGRTRVIRGVVALRLSPAEREQIATAAGLQKMPLSTYVRCAALQASVVAVGTPRPPRRERPAAEREVPVLDWAPAKEAALR